MRMGVAEGVNDSLISPAAQTFEIVPSDEADLPVLAKAIYVGTGGDVRLKAIEDSEFTVFRNVPSGSFLDVRTKAIALTGTSASNIVGVR